MGLSGSHAYRGVQREAVEVQGGRPALGALYGAVKASPSTSAGQPPVW